MHRIDLLQNKIIKHGYQTYMEIGVFNGKTFLKLKCKKKIAVDPEIKISWLKKLVWIFNNPSNFNNSYCEMTSAHFFGNHHKFIAQHSPIDLVFVDGQHTFKTSLEDVLSSLKILSEQGQIVVHDCFPQNKAAAYPAESYEEAKKAAPEGWNGNWNGDVWKTILYLREKYPEELEIEVINSDFGLGVVNPKKRINASQIDLEVYEKIDRLGYDYLKANAKQLLNLKEYKAG